MPDLHLIRKRSMAQKILQYLNGVLFDDTRHSWNAYREIGYDTSANRQAGYSFLAQKPITKLIPWTRHTYI